MGLSIDRKKVIKGLETCYRPPASCDDCPYNSREECNDMLCLDALQLLKELQKKPEVVLCRDCKYGDSVKNAKGEMMIECALLDEGWLKEPDWFCADAEMKDGDGNE